MTAVRRLLLLPQLFSDAFSRESQLLACDPRSHTCLATALMMRGRLSLSDAQRNIARLRPTLKMAHWNTEVGAAGRLAAV
jgi:tubulin epsilon